MISVVILTKNEEQDLPFCLESISWCDDIHILDSYSTDRTIDIANEAGAKVTQRKFDGYASQRNAALEMLDYKYQWILILDADERVPNNLVPLLYYNIQKATNDISGFRLRRRDFLDNTWLKHAQISPLYIRLIRRGKARYHREINEVLEVDGKVEEIDGYFDHYPFSKGLTHWLSKHNQYSSMEAIRWVEESKGAVSFSLQKAIFSQDFSDKRFHQKGLFYKIPGRPLIKLLYMLIWRKAFLDGRAGFKYAALQSIYEYFIVLKTKEILNKENV
jgi:glycosyltransferase involved in cell wall biosynthesis